MPKKKSESKAPAGKAKTQLFSAPAARTKTIQKSDKKQPAKSTNPLFQQSRKKNFGIGRDIQPKRDLTRFVRWPKYIKLQRQRRILWHRLKVPGIINQFNRTLDKHTAANLLNFLEKYAPEDKKQKGQRLLEATKSKEGDLGKRSRTVQYGLSNVTKSIENKKAKLVVIAHDVDPIELVMWIPTLCRKKGVPYVIIKGKSRLGKVVRRKTASCLAVTEIDTAKDGKEFSNFLEKATDNFLERYSETIKTFGGGIMGTKHNAKKAKDDKRVLLEKKRLA